MKKKVKCELDRLLEAWLSSRYEEWHLLSTLRQHREYNARVDLENLIGMGELHRLWQRALARRRDEEA
jgi:Holliday junction resolvase